MPRSRMGWMLLALYLGVVGVALIVLFGCAAPSREIIFEPGGPTTEQVWHAATTPTALLGHQVGHNPGFVTAPGTDDWTRTARTELDGLFPTLDNPHLLLYVFPHLTAEGAPIPGYTTAFPLYEQAAPFALPGEAIRQGVWR